MTTLGVDPVDLSPTLRDGIGNVVPGAKAEEMYRPETFGRSATDSVVVR